MNTYYREDLKNSYLILEGKEGDTQDYKVTMLRENDIPGILKTEVRYRDNQSLYCYDISGKTSLKTYYERARITEEDMRGLVTQLLRVIETLQKYMLDSKYLLLEPTYIFRRGEQFSFCYYPAFEGDAKEEFHKLTEFFVREVDYKDEGGIHFAYTIHKATMEENYSIAKILEDLAPSEEREEEIVTIDYGRESEQENMEEIMVAEKQDFWEPVKRLLERKWKKEDL